LVGVQFLSELPPGFGPHVDDAQQEVGAGPPESGDRLSLARLFERTGTDDEPDTQVLWR
jgi:hypothetical protein